MALQARTSAPTGALGAVVGLGSWGERELVGVGRARLNPADRNVAEIGDELAVARALSDLGKRMLTVTTEDIESVTHEAAEFLY